MKKAVALNWINALRSGEYKQGTDLLHNKKDNTYCCLGVLNCLYPNLELDTALSNSKSYEILPGAYKIGLNSPLGHLPNSGTNLAQLNDAGYTFDEIADIIQIEYVEGL